MIDDLKERVARVIFETTIIVQEMDDARKIASAAIAELKSAGYDIVKREELELRYFGEIPF